MLYAQEEGVLKNDDLARGVHDGHVHVLHSRDVLDDEQRGGAHALWDAHSHAIINAVSLIIHELCPVFRLPSIFFPLNSWLIPSPPAVHV